MEDLKMGVSSAKGLQLHDGAFDKLLTNNKNDGLNTDPWVTRAMTFEGNGVL